MSVIVPYNFKACLLHPSRLNRVGQNSVPQEKSEKDGQRVRHFRRGMRLRRVRPAAPEGVPMAVREPARAEAVRVQHPAEGAGIVGR